MCYPDGDTVIYLGGEEQQIELPGSGRAIPTFAYNYDSQSARPTVIILHDVYGAKQIYRDMGKRLADENFAALLPDLFCREGELADTTREAVTGRASKHSFPVALEDIKAITDHLDRAGSKIGLIGFCMGGTLAMLAASRLPKLNASVVYYGFPVNKNPTANRPDNPINEVSNLQVPILGLFGEEDAGVGVDNVRAYEAAAQAAGKNLEVTIYPAVGHGFLTFDPAAPTASASHDSWERTLAFLKEHLS